MYTHIHMSMHTPHSIYFRMVVPGRGMNEAPAYCAERLRGLALRIRFLSSASWPRRHAPPGVGFGSQGAQHGLIQEYTLKYRGISSDLIYVYIPYSAPSRRRTPGFRAFSTSQSWASLTGRELLARWGYFMRIMGKTMSIWDTSVKQAESSTH